jgi:hypothetical protein
MAPTTPNGRRRAHELIDLLFDEIEAASRRDGRDDFSSSYLPPMTSRRVFHEKCRAGLVAGATKTGRVWRCSRESWFQARARTAAPRPHVLTQTDEARADELIERAGFRFTTGAR